MKKTLSVILSLVLIFSVINLGGITAFAENETIIDGDYSYRLLDDGTYELLSYDGTDTDLIIPSEFRGLPVTVLGVYSCGLCDNLTNVVIPDTITSIGSQCFKKNPSLKTVTIPQSGKEIGEGAFSECPSLKRVNIENLAVWCEINFGDQDASPFCFASELYLNGKPLKNVEIPSSVKKISNYAFYMAPIKTLKIPLGVTEIGIGAFVGCKNLTSISLPSSIKSIDRAAFMECTALTEVTIPRGVEIVDEFAFYKCSGLKKVTVPSTVTSVTISSFNSCTSLEELVVLSEANLEFGDLGSTALTIYAKSGTPTESYAKANNIPFTSLLIGDTDGDGSVGISDLTLVSIYLSGKGELTSAQAACADINEDSTVDAFDMFYIDKAIYA